MYLLRHIETYLRRSGGKATPFGVRAANDPRLVWDLRNGREPGPRLCHRVMTYIAEQGQ
jgi:hypothetical protein